MNKFYQYIFILSILSIALCSKLNLNKFPDDKDKWTRKNEKFLEYIKQTQDNKYVLHSQNTNATHIYLEAVYTGSEKYIIKNSSYIVQNLSIEIIQLSDHDISLKIRDSNRTRWELPDDGQYPGDYGRAPQTTENIAYEITWVANPFTLKITRKITKETIFDTSDKIFVYSNQYIQFETKLSTGKIYGLGERASLFGFDNGTYTIFNKDQWENFEDGTSGHNLYGYQPVYLNAEESDYFNVILFRSTNAMDIQIQNASRNSSIQFRVIGGIIDLRIFLSKTKEPEAVVGEYHRYLGGWEQPPFWGFGFHQCRYGYRNLSQVKEVISNYTYHGLPIDTIWLDIDYMQDYKVFTIDESRYNISEFEQIREKEGLRFVPIIDPGISWENHTALEEGLKRNIFIKSTDNPDKLLVGKLWPGYVYYIDYLHPNSTQYWKDMLQSLYNTIKFDGIWLDMNEMANVCDGECDVYDNNTQNDLGLYGEEEEDRHNPDIPYYPGNSKLDYGTISPSAVQYNNYSQYDLHSIGVYLEKMQTQKFLKENLGHKLTFIISRSSFYGSGRWGHHWSGDNAATWESLRFSITSVFQYNLFGAPFMGADICGCKQNTTAELCARWMQLGSLYPFSRNHNALEAPDQEPYVFNELVTNTSRNALKFRYALLKYYFTQFLIKNGTGTIFRPLFFEFPTHQPLYDNQIMNDQFLLGKDLMVAPVLQEGAESVNVYFPPGEWYNVFDGQIYKGGNRYNVINKLPDPVPTFLRDGAVLFLQDTTTVTRSWQLNNTVELIVALKQNSNTAYGVYAGVSNYSNDEEVYKKCIQDNCLIDIAVEQQSSVIMIAYGPQREDFDIEDSIQIGSTTIFLRNEKKPENIRAVLKKNENVLQNVEIIQSSVEEKIYFDPDFNAEKHYYILKLKFLSTNMSAGNQLEILYE